MTARPVHDRRFTTVTISAAVLAASLAIVAYLLLRLDGQPFWLQHTAMFVVAGVVHVAVFATTRPWWRS